MACMYRRAGLKLKGRRVCAWQQKGVGNESLMVVSQEKSEESVVVVVDMYEQWMKLSMHRNRSCKDREEG